MRISDVLKAKASQEVVTIAPEAGVRDLLATLGEHNIGACIVSFDGGATVAGIVSERDVVRHLHSDGTVINNTVGAIMTETVETCAPDDQLDDVMQTMTDHRIRHLPVCQDGRLVGVVSIGDVVKHKIGQLQFERDQLDHYVNQS
ncbi:CBS domain-containing protein [Nocardioides ferulae]|uniref:CBS domain-containing protein n=1 Tax=Nocardioides ferulae TaxID=2340821 RepID=UPI000EB19686|nr:CBS domain-containing protein [Nocardioides ferulae]